MKNYILFIFLLAISFSSFAQPMSKYEFEKNIAVGDERFEIGDYFNALELYKESYKEKKDLNLALRIAETYYMLKDYKHSMKYVKNILKKDKKGMFFHSKLLYAKCLKRLGEYQEAYNEFIDFAKKTDDPDSRTEAILEINGLELFDSMQENVEMEFKPLNKDVNKGFSIYGLQRRNSNDEIYLGYFDTSSKIVLDGKSNEVKSKKRKKKKSKKKGKKKKEESGDIRGQISISKRDADGNYSKPKALDKRINRIESHSLYPAFSLDGETLYYTRISMKGTEVLESKLFLVKEEDGEWGAPYELENVNGDFISKMPSVGEMLGQEALFFVSDMEGTTGGLDIFYSLINNDGSLSEPVNLGKKINTVDDEITPFSVEGKLYFSTNGRPGLGGFDIYVSTWNGKEWSEAENAGKGFNSSVDDLGLSISADGRSGFLLSNRMYNGKKRIISKTCCNQAYRISARELVIKLIVNVFDENGKLKNAKVQLVDLSKVDPESPVTKSNFSGNDFNFLLDSDKPYKAVVTCDGYDPGEIKFNTAGIFDDFTVEKEITLKKAEPEVEIITINQPIRLSNIYYDFNDYKILPDAEEDLDRLVDLMNEYPEMIIELSSHTDVRGGKKYNLKLSQRRAESAKQYLVENGITGMRIKPVGYGESMILNHCKEGVKCTDDEHRFNRRTEFKILAGPKEIIIKKEVFKNKK